MIGGFHLYNPTSRKRESDELIYGIADRLNNGTTMYYTCHCTGKNVYEIMKKILGDKIEYISTGRVFFVINILKKIFSYVNINLQSNPIITVSCFLGGSYGTRKKVSGFKFK